jgi:hypothetical protein
MQRNALNATEICTSSSAHRRFQEWEQAGVFHVASVVALPEAAHHARIELTRWLRPSSAARSRS